MEQFAKFLNMSVGVCWYDWRRPPPLIPTTRTIFPEEKALRLGRSDCKRRGFSWCLTSTAGSVSRAVGHGDTQWSAVAKAATEDESSVPYTETCCSTEAEDSPMRMAVVSEIGW